MKQENKTVRSGSKPFPPLLAVLIELLFVERAGQKRAEGAARLGSL